MFSSGKTPANFATRTVRQVSFLAAILCSCSSPKKDDPTNDVKPIAAKDKKPPATPVGQVRFPEVDALVADFMRDEDPAGAIVVVGRNGTVLHNIGYGLADVDAAAVMPVEAKLPIASITKVFTAAAIHTLANKGHLSLDDRVGHWIPSWPKDSDLRLRHLLEHTAGLSEAGDWLLDDQIARKDILTRLLELKVQAAPGERFQYGNTGYILLGFVIESVSTLTYSEYLQRTFFAPLGIQVSECANTKGELKSVPGHQKDEAGPMRVTAPSTKHISSAGGLCATGLDILRFFDALRNEKLFPKSSLLAMTQAAKLNDGTIVSYGQGFALGKLGAQEFIAHSGDMLGYQSQVANYQPDGLTVVVLMNTSFAGAPLLAERVARALLKIPIDDDVVVDSAMLDQYAGRYKIPRFGELIISRKDNLLMLQLAGGPEFQLLAKDQQSFVVDGNESMKLKFVLVDGVVEAVAFDQAGMSERAEKLKP
tara:strand:+ start:378573 stop:380012 length:1440 start_codon:yes stop_codon:yes gene_type:complete